MRAGNLDRKITLQRFSETRDAYNAPVLSWATLAIVWAAFEPVSDGERLRADEVAASATARFRIRYSTTVDGLNPKDRVLYEAVVFDILHVKPMGRRVGLEITARARAETPANG